MWDYTEFTYNVRHKISTERKYLKYIYNNNNLFLRSHPSLIRKHKQNLVHPFIMRPPPPSDFTNPTIPLKREERI
jgi:hypothetical protein